MTTTGAAIILLCIGLPGLAWLIGRAIGLHFGGTTGSDEIHP